MSRNNYFLVIAVFVVVIVIAGWFVLSSKSTPTNQVGGTTGGTNYTSPPAESEKPSTPNQPTSEAKNEPQLAKNIVTYSDAGFSPSELTIKVGDTVTWVNNSSDKMWVASAKHPTHTVYPTTGGCIGSTFDACKGDPPGSSWSFKFDVAGTWGYHDHLDASHFGKIVVQP